MEDETKERWYQLCQLAAVERDPERLVALAQEISRLLEEKEESIKQKRRGPGVVHPYKPR